MGLPLASPDTVLQSEIDDAWAYISERACGLDLSALDATSNKGRLALRAVKLRTIQQAVQGQGSFVSASVNNLVKSFSVPGYSETRFDPATQSNKFLHSSLNEWPVLADLIWSIMDQDCRDQLIALFNNENAPASTIVEHDWWWPGGFNIPNRYGD